MPALKQKLKSINLFENVNPRFLMVLKLHRKLIFHEDSLPLRINHAKHLKMISEIDS